MIILASTSDLLLLVTREAANVDVHVTWSDLLSPSVTPGRTNTLVTTATTTTIVGSPASSTYRAIKSITIRNSGTTPTNITVTHRASGPVDAQLIACALPPSSSLHYEEHRGWLMRRGGAIERAVVTVTGTPAVGALYTHALTNDVAVASATATRLIDVRELGFWAVEGLRYWFRFNIFYTSSSTGNGGRFAIYGPGVPTAMRMRMDVATTTTTKTSFDGQLAYDVTSTVVSSAATGSNYAFIEGQIDQPTVDGLFYLRIGSEVALNTITVKAGTNLQWQRTT